MSNPPLPPRHADGEDDSWHKGALFFFRWFLPDAQNGIFPRTHQIAEVLTIYEKWLTYGWPETDQVKVAYDSFMHVLKANKNPIPQKGQLEHNYAARSANLKSASEALKEALRQYGNK